MSLLFSFSFPCLHQFMDTSHIILVFVSLSFHERVPSRFAQPSLIQVRLSLFFVGLSRWKAICARKASTIGARATRICESGLTVHRCLSCSMTVWQSTSWVNTQCRDG
jgi:hypothetical protein